MAWKIIYKFNTDQGGFSEVWATGDSTNPDRTNTDKVLQLAKRRLALCGKGAVLMGIRVSVVQPRPRPTYNVPLGTPNTIAATIVADNTTYNAAYGSNQNPDQLQTCIQLQCYSQGGNRKPVYLAGIPDDIIVTAPNGPTTITDAQWNNNYIAWVNYLQGNNFGWIGKSNAGGFAPAGVIAWVPAPAPALGLYAIVQGALPANIAIGAKTQVLATRMSNKALKSPNGTWTVSGTGAYTPIAGTNYVWFAAIQGIDSTQITTLGQVQAVAKFGTFYQLVSVFISRQGSHKRGDFFGRYHGRVSKPARV